ncbi:MAG: FkbM family methyltransferase [Candidatus Gracilibacteria bacterium]|nr:FkbM family methyltransferase [Candidatus Gracilibacteria bacterium]
MTFFTKIYSLSKFTFDCIIKGGFQYIFKYYIFYFIPVIIFRKVKNNNISVYNVVFPNNSGGWAMIKEVFIDECYKIPENKFYSALDLGGFCGDTGIYFLKKGIKKIDIFEVQPDLLNLIKENINNYNKNGLEINIHKKAIGIGSPIELFIRKELINGDPGILYENTNNKDIIKINIESENILKYLDYDIIKMDIEGGEYSIFKEFINNNIKLKYKLGYIEVHFFKENVNINYNEFIMFKDYLEKQGYKLEYEFNKNQIDEMLEKENKIGLLFKFYK